MPDRSELAKRIIPMQEFWILEHDKRKEPKNFKNIQHIWGPRKASFGVILHWIMFYGHRN